MKLGENLPPWHDALLLSIGGTGSVVCQVAQTQLDIYQCLWLPSHGPLRGSDRNHISRSPLTLSFFHVSLAQNLQHFSSGYHLLRHLPIATRIGFSPGLLSGETPSKCALFQERLFHRPPTLTSGWKFSPCIYSLVWRCLSESARQYFVRLKITAARKVITLCLLRSLC